MHITSTDIEAIFADVFYHSHRTVLVGGATEPLYLPAHAPRDHLLYYRSNFVNSALHEVAHWTIAGAHRRNLVDFGYNYEPDGRSQTAQREFEKVEAKPQALEWIFCTALGIPFHASADNLSGGLGVSQPFLTGISEAAQAQFQMASPAKMQERLIRTPRADMFLKALLAWSGLISEFRTIWELPNPI